MRPEAPRVWVGAVNEAVVIAFLGVFASTTCSPKRCWAHKHPEMLVIK